MTICKQGRLILRTVIRGLSIHYFFKDWSLFPITLPRNTKSVLAFFLDDLIDSIWSLFMLLYSYANVFFFY